MLHYNSFTKGGAQFYSMNELVSQLHVKVVTGLNGYYNYCKTQSKAARARSR